MTLKLVTAEDKRRSEVREGIIAELKKLLTEAEDDTFASIVVVAIRFKSCIPPGSDACRVIGYLETLKYDMIGVSMQPVEDANGSA